MHNPSSVLVFKKYWLLYDKKDGKTFFSSKVLNMTTRFWLKIIQNLLEFFLIIIFLRLTKFFSWFGEKKLMAFNFFER